ncbi:hypothetical protein COW36_13965 [bacterium (Candidatus Blackallbacteria) CG17_big_fil_post_rev_8_21_14_2_50_48_46]|uniref:Uncharacterized protein n=1 Tax=bacterium (Candidatus Blackallbacteria) CG17_big_fil_post_rev_8_21_14_2_50_48_46 TaxID=2014261 RepID=A0A2M7G333_9BACT|nr:MAG: hypothetical protein COW64_23435 [bacterium (Candidatus Blackallbacteria) CG18_big_fil_WC_8_21_14_2_50_49_26]PIW16232.1 MAG: hypothetical protein COW36_13965 [bacterium (Candidatus Blackallbacteria) CG17_big_fil_post_rev_8_21_14_2_50_48_46]PIW49886.1 MAG: hypothetical protein COW20_04340 [bacterium (Candidatus Blackallbacteria) CG13_big_fil_rev_8_21_14_2_50_49_14]
MSVPQGIVPLIKAFQLAQISEQEYLLGLERAQAQCEQKKAQLMTSAVRAQDRQDWEQIIRPGLLACLDVMAGAALEAREYVHQRDPQILENIVMLFAQVDQATAMIEQRLGTVSSETKALVGEILTDLQQDSVQMTKNLKGSADTTISMFD